MSNMREYCSECEQLSDFTEVKLHEKSTIKDVVIENEHVYYQCSNCGELFEPFDDPDYNTRMDFDQYRSKLGLLSPEEIKQIRENYNLTLRQFSELLGISYSTLSEIENGSLQSKHLDATLRLAQTSNAIRKLYFEKRNKLKANYDNFEKIINKDRSQYNYPFYKIAKNITNVMFYSLNVWGPKGSRELLTEIYKNIEKEPVILPENKKKSSMNISFSDSPFATKEKIKSKYEDSNYRNTNKRDISEETTWKPIPQPSS